MRAALWIAVLIAAFVLAWKIQDRWGDDRRAERDAAYARPSESGGELPEGYSRAIVGEPSGAAPITPPVVNTPVPRASGTAKPLGADAAESGSLRHHVVQPGDTLSQICTAAYGTARKDVVDAVARANGLSKPEAIRSGQRLVLPPLAELRSQPR